MMGQVRTSLYTLGATSKNSAVAAVKTDFGGQPVETMKTAPKIITSDAFKRAGAAPMMKESNQQLDSNQNIETKKYTQPQRFTQNKPVLQAMRNTTMKVMEKDIKVPMWKRIMFGESATHRDYDPLAKLQEKETNFKKDKVYTQTSSD